MKYLVGICGLGKGHSSRQYEIIRRLVSRGHEVRVCTFGEGHKYFGSYRTEEVESVPLIDVYVPMVIYKHGKLDIPETIRLNIKTFIPGTIRNIKIAKRLKKDGFIPDVCITDYEPVVARFAYAFKRPLVCIDQQSKFIFMPDGDIRGFRCREEKSRLGMFFPRVYGRYILSFYKLPGTELPPGNELLYPIISREMVTAYERYKNEDNLVSRPSIAVYFSTYVEHTVNQSYADMIEIFKKFPEYDFKIFSSKLYESGEHGSENVSVYRNEREAFLHTLVNASGVIGTAGHTTISEAMYCSKPYFAIPLPTYDQNYCAKFIADNRIGVGENRITEENLGEFLGNLESFVGNIATCTNLVPKADTLTYLVDELERIGRDEDACNRIR